LFCSRFRPRAVLSISREELKKLKKCSLYRIGELLIKKYREFTIGFPHGVRIRWEEEVSMLYAHKIEKGGKISVKIFFSPNNTLTELPLNNKPEI